MKFKSTDFLGTIRRQSINFLTIADIRQKVILKMVMEDLPLVHDRSILSLKSLIEEFHNRTFEKDTFILYILFYFRMIIAHRSFRK